MIPPALIRAIGEPLAKVVFWIVVGLLILVMFAIGRCALAPNPVTEQTKIDIGQASAMGASGAQAVATVSNVMANDAAADTLTTENANAIDHAEGAHTVVPPASRAAGVHALCARASFAKSNPTLCM